MDSALASLPATGYRYRFGRDEHDAIGDCLRSHGFAIVERMLDDALVDELARGVRAIADRTRFNSGWNSRTAMNFVELAPEALRLLEHEPYLRLLHHLHGTDELCIHRSAAIIRPQGDRGVTWHRDTCERPAGVAPRTANEVLNRPDLDYLKFSSWFYLTGCRPEHGGLCVIPDTHRPDWTPPPGFRLYADGKNICRAEGPEEPYTGFDIPGTVQLIAAPGDQILFGAFTFHAAHPNTLPEPRLSCAVGLRPRRVRIETPWAWPDSAHALRRRMPEHLHGYLDGYTSIVPDWSAAKAGD